MENQFKLNDISNELLILNKITVDKLFMLDNGADCVALYLLYYKTAKWQKTNIVKANDVYIRKMLNWGSKRVLNAKNELRKNGFINIVQQRNKGKIENWYIEVHYLVSSDCVQNIKYYDVEEENQPQHSKTTSGYQETNALRDNNKCLKICNKEKYKKESDFEEFWKLYPKKVDRKKCLQKYLKIQTSQKIILDSLNNYIEYIKQNHKEQYIKNPLSWLNGECWNDDYNVKIEADDDIYTRIEDMQQLS